MRKRKINSNGCKGDYFSKHIANTRHLKRILTYLLSIKDLVRITQIERDLGIANGQIKDALAFLTGYNLILVAKNNSVHYYFINPLFKKTKDKINFIMRKYVNQN